MFPSHVGVFHSPFLAVGTEFPAQAHLARCHKGLKINLKIFFFKCQTHVGDIQGQVG